MLDILHCELAASGIIEVRQGFIPHSQTGVPEPGRRCDGFVYILEGICHYTFSYGDHFTVKQGDILYLSKDAVYTMDVDCHRYAFIVVDFDFISDSFRSCRVFSSKGSGEAEGLFRRMLHIYTSLQTARNTECLSVLYRLYSYLIRQATAEQTGSRMADVITSVRQYMDEHLSSDLQISHLAKKAGMSEVYFRRLFRQMYTISPVQYLKRARIEYACRLLRYAPMRLEEAAKASGFASLPYFCKVFKEITGTTPTEFRSSILENKELT